MAVCESEFEKLTDELINAKDRSIMHLRRYYEVASALGFNPERGHVAHSDILARARACKAAYDGVREGVR